MLASSLLLQKKRKEKNKSKHGRSPHLQTTNKSNNDKRTNSKMEAFGKKKGGNEIPRVSFGEIRIVRTVD
jgi:hypothetical protein